MRNRKVVFVFTNFSPSLSDHYRDNVSFFHKWFKFSKNTKAQMYQIFTNIF